MCRKTVAKREKTRRLGVARSPLPTANQSLPQPQAGEFGGHGPLVGVGGVDELLVATIGITIAGTNAITPRAIAVPLLM